MEVYSKLKTSWGEVKVVRVSRTSLEAVEAMGRAKRTKEALSKNLNVKNDTVASQRVREVGEKLLNSLEENYGKIIN